MWSFLSLFPGPYFVTTGQMVVADLTTGVFMETDAISKELATKHDYSAWLAQSLRPLSAVGPSTFLSEPMHDAATVLRMQAANGEHQTTTITSVLSSWTVDVQS